MKTFAAVLVLGCVLITTPVTLTGPARAGGIYKLQLLIDIYTVLDRCAALDAPYEAMRESVLRALKAEGFTESHIAMVVSADATGHLDHAGCAASIRPLLTAYLAIPE